LEAATDYVRAATCENLRRQFVAFARSILLRAPFVSISHLREVFRTRVTPMAEHKFKIGQIVYLRSKRSNSPLSPSSGPYQIVRRLPVTEGEFQYVIRSANEDHQRVVRESELTRF
jgi:hypothetical protein